MNVKELADLIDEHSLYCLAEYQPDKFPHMSLNEALEFQDRMKQSLTHFSMWLRLIKSKEAEDK